MVLAQIQVLYAASDEQELGIKNSAYADKGKISFQEGVEKSKQLLKKFEHMKNTVVQAISKPSKEGTPSVLKSLTAKKPVEGPDTLRLKNGQWLTGVWIREKDKNGLWVEVEEGSRVYVRKEEIEEIQHASQTKEGA